MYKLEGDTSETQLSVISEDWRIGGKDRIVYTEYSRIHALLNFLPIVLISCGSAAL